MDKKPDLIEKKKILMSRTGAVAFKRKICGTPQPRP
jgi:hypothetical protein